MLWDDETFDSRQVIDRLGELEDTTDPDELAERAILAELADEASKWCADWEYGETFIADWYFERYAQELAEDIGAISREYAWPASHIDWEAAADALRQDYTTYTIAGHDYYAR